MGAFLTLAGPADCPACDAALHAVRDALGPEPAGAALRVLGTGGGRRRAYILVCEYDRDVPGTMEYAARGRAHLARRRGAGRA